MHCRTSAFSFKPYAYRHQSYYHSIRYCLVNLAPSPTESIQYDKLQQFASVVSQSKNLLVITGAGISTESGIPDYRSPKRINTYTPIKYQDFIKSVYARRRYWARSTIGYETHIKLAKPNIAHNIISKWKQNESNGNKMRLITQNVDSLHLKSSFPHGDMLELHGSLRNVGCLQCQSVVNRDEFQNMLMEHNPAFVEKNLMINKVNSNTFDVKPDGDIQLNDNNYDYNTFVIPKCIYCNAMDCIRPNIVFFGENLDKLTTNVSINWSKNTDCIIVCGSTLQTQSSYRLLRYARETNPLMQIIIVNIGETRGDDICDLKVEYYVSDVLKHVDQLL
eukprot:3253_1